MTDYADRTKDLVQDAKKFAQSEFGVYVLETIREKLEGELTEMSSKDQLNRDWHSGRYSAIKELLEVLEVTQLD